MPAKTTREKESQIIRLHLQGESQTKIAETAGVSQSTVSQAVSRYKKDASETSLDAASARRGVGDIVDALRSLSADLRKAGITANEARRGCGLKVELDKLGADTDMLDNLLAVYRRITPKEFPIQDFVKATAQMIRLEKESGMTYKNILSEYEDKHVKLNGLKEQIRNESNELTEIRRKKGEAEADLEKYLDKQQTTLERVDRSLEVRKGLEKAGLSIEAGEVVANMLKLFSDLIEEKGLAPEKAAVELEKFLNNARSLEKATDNLGSEVDKLRTSRNSLEAEVQNLESQKNKLTLDNMLLQQATESVTELMQKHEMRVGEIVRIKSLAQKYGPPASILEALETYKSLKEIEEKKAGLEGAVNQLTEREASLIGKIKTVDEELATLPAKVDESMRGFRSSLERFSEQLQGLGSETAKASGEVDTLKEKALAAGREVAAVESRVKAYKLTSKLIDFVTNRKGEEADIAGVAIRFLNCLSEWVKDQSKYVGTKQQIESLRDKIERQLILG